MKAAVSRTEPAGINLSSRKIHRLRRWIDFRRALIRRRQRLLSGIKTYDQAFVIVVAVLIGVMGGFIATGFQFLIALFQKLLWGQGPLLDVIQAAPLYLKLAIPTLGLAIVAWGVHLFAREAKGHGVPEVMDAVASRNGFIRMRVVLVKALASALSIGSGGSVGREGPIVQIGSAFGSSVGQLFQVSRRRMKTFVGCGAAAGIAATFNAPIAGAIFASEIILGDFSVSSIGPIMISSVLATVISHGFHGNYPAFIPPVYHLHTSLELVFYSLLGIAAGITGWIFIKTLYFSEDLFDKLKVHVAVKAIIGGLFMGTTAVFVPQVMGVGYETVTSVLTGTLPGLLAVLLLVSKLLATSITLGAGGSGGIFAPSLFMGSMLGGAMGVLFQALAPAIPISPGAYALVGMAAVVAATTFAPITAILIIFEMTMEYTVILPVMISSIIAMIITQQLSKGSIYTIKLKRRGVELYRGRDINVLKRLRISSLKHTRFDTVAADLPLRDALTRIAETEQSNLYVVNTGGELMGTLSMGSVRRYLNQYQEVPPDSTALDLANSKFVSVTDTTPVDEALRIMTEMDVNDLAVIDDLKQITGTITKAAILREYQELLLQEESASTLGSALKFVQKYTHPKSEVMHGFYIARIDIPSPFVNATVAELNIRQKYGVDVLLIRRRKGQQVINHLPDARIRMQVGDQLLIFGREKDVERVCNLA